MKNTEVFWPIQKIFRPFFFLHSAQPACHCCYSIDKRLLLALWGQQLWWGVVVTQTSSSATVNELRSVETARQRFSRVLREAHAHYTRLISPPLMAHTVTAAAQDCFMSANSSFLSAPWACMCCCSSSPLLLPSWSSNCSPVHYIPAKAAFPLATILPLSETYSQEQSQWWAVKCTAHHCFDTWLLCCFPFPGKLTCDKRSHAQAGTIRSDE